MGQNEGTSDGRTGITNKREREREREDRGREAVCVVTRGSERNGVEGKERTL
jgi:hypothetical protein